MNEEQGKAAREALASLSDALKFSKMAKELRLPPDGYYGDCEVKTAHTNGIRHFKIHATGDFQITTLGDSQDIPWMSTAPCEVQMMHEDAAKFPGGKRILVCGLGLGVFQQFVESKYKEVVVLDINPGMAPRIFEIIKADNWRLVIGDARTFDRHFQHGAFDAVYFDHWQFTPSEKQRARDGGIITIEAVS